MAVTTYGHCLAMGATFEVLLVGEDEEHLRAVVEAVLDEVARVERLLSRFDSASAIARINRQAGRQPVVVDLEVWEILRACCAAYQWTGGYFDVTAPCDPEPLVPATTKPPLILDELERTVSLRRPGRTIDLGGFDKGYALDLARKLLRDFHVDAGLIHGGTSSIVAVGTHPSGSPWPIDLRDPFAADANEAPALTALSLRDQALSCSAVLLAGQQVSDKVDPHQGKTLTEQAACVVIAPTAAEAEILSTACLCMGMERARAYTEGRDQPGVHVGWIDQDDGALRLTWLTEAP